VDGDALDPNFQDQEVGELVEASVNLKVAPTQPVTELTVKLATGPLEQVGGTYVPQLALFHWYIPSNNE
jgi:hypothetical protein